LHSCKTTSLWTFEQAGEEEIKGGANEAGFEIEDYVVISTLFINRYH